MFRTTWVSESTFSTVNVKNSNTATDQVSPMKM